MNIKQELIKRYKYLYENASFILAPFIYEQTKEEFEQYKKIYPFKKPLIYLKINLLGNINSAFEEFLLSDKKVEDTKLYQLVKIGRNNKEYLNQVQKGLKLIQKGNEGKPKSCLITMDVLDILNKTYNYIEEQSGDLINKNNKLKVLDEYYRIASYKNDGKIYKNRENSDLLLQKREPIRSKNDVGITNNFFITSVLSTPHHKNNLSIFTEEEKQKVYLQYHDELPCDLGTICRKDSTLPEISRPNNTDPCGMIFTIKEEEIFKDENNKYYQLCPYCGYIVNIPERVLSNGIKKRIEDRCNKDDKLYRKMYLYSELFSLDTKSTNEQKKLLKK